MFNLRRLLTINVKDKDEPEDRPGAVYKIKCSYCQATYIGERPAETQPRDYPNTNELLKRVISTTSPNTT